MGTDEFEDYIVPKVSMSFYTVCFGTASSYYNLLITVIVIIIKISLNEMYSYKRVHPKMTKCIVYYCHV